MTMSDNNNNNNNGTFIKQSSLIIRIIVSGELYNCDNLNQTYNVRGMTMREKWISPHCLRVRENAKTFAMLHNAMSVSFSLCLLAVSFQFNSTLVLFSALLETRAILKQQQQQRVFCCCC